MRKKIFFLQITKQKQNVINKIVFENKVDNAFPSQHSMAEDSGRTCTASEENQS